MKEAAQLSADETNAPDRIDSVLHKRTCTIHSKRVQLSVQKHC